MTALLPSGATLHMLSFYDNKNVFCYRAVLNRVLIKYKKQITPSRFVQIEGHIA